MKQVFGKKSLARSVEAASIWSARSKMDAITLDGDLCSRKGALTGGYVDSSKSRLRAPSRQEVAAQKRSILRGRHRGLIARLNWTSTAA